MEATGQGVGKAPGKSNCEKCSDNNLLLIYLTFRDKVKLYIFLKSAEIKLSF